MLNLIIKIGAKCWFKVRIPWSRFWRFLEWRKASVPLILNFVDLKKILNRIEWTSDPWWKLGDVLQSPEWTWAKKKDDCDGFALVSLAIMLESRLGIGYLVTSVTRPIKHSHSIALFPWDALVHRESGIVVTQASHWKWTSNAWLMETRKDSFAALIKRIFPDPNDEILAIDVRNLNLKNCKKELQGLFRDA